MTAIKVELIGGYFDGMKTMVELGQQDIKLMAPAPEALVYKPDDTPSTSELQAITYQRRLPLLDKYDWVKE